MNKKVEISDNDIIRRLTNKILQYRGQTIDGNQLDNILEIDNTENPDNKRVKRSKLIHEINLSHKTRVGKELIQRQKDTTDKRFIMYCISEK